jgi:hypothetical protein
MGQTLQRTSNFFSGEQLPFFYDAHRATS